MTARAIQFVVDDDAFIRVMTGTGRVLVSVIDVAAIELAADVEEDAGQVSSRLGEGWEISGAGPTERTVTAPEFWAYFLAHGTGAHGPTSAEKLVFNVGGETVFADFVSGIPANPFDERAVETASSKLSALIDRALQAVH